MTTLPPELLADLRRLALLEKKQARPAWIDPDDVLALLDRIEALENPRPLSPDDREALRNGGDR